MSANELPVQPVDATLYRLEGERRTMAPLAAGHLLSMFVILLPFALMTALLDWQREIRIGASAAVIAFGVFRLVNRRHPRALARIRPSQLVSGPSQSRPPTAQV